MQQRIRTLGIDPTTRGLGFVALEGSKHLIDFGSKYARGEETEEFVTCAEKLFERFQPELVVLEELEGSRRQKRAQERIQAILDRADERDIPILPAPRAAVLRTFEDTGTTKYEIACELARRFPDLASELPPERKLWRPEDERMNVFDALSFALTVLLELESS